MKRRSAFITVSVLTCLVVVVSLAGSLVVSTLRARREANVRHQLRQTDYLLDAGIQLAFEQVQKNPDYAGETWEPVDTIPHFHEAKVVINVLNEAEGSLGIEVIASLADRPVEEGGSHGFVTQRSHRWISNRTPNSSSQ